MVQTIVCLATKIKEFHKWGNGGKRGGMICQRSQLAAGRGRLVPRTGVFGLPVQPSLASPRIKKEMQSKGYLDKVKEERNGSNLKSLCPSFVSVVFFTRVVRKALCWDPWVTGDRGTTRLPSTSLRRAIQSMWQNGRRGMLGTLRVPPKGISQTPDGAPLPLTLSCYLRAPLPVHLWRFSPFPPQGHPL